MKPVATLQHIADAPSLEWLNDEFGSLERVAPMILRFKATLKNDTVALLATRTPAEAATLLHRIAGGVRVFGASRVARELDALERALRGVDGDEAMSRLPGLVEALVEFMADLDTLTRNAPKE